MWGLGRFQPPKSPTTTHVLNHSQSSATTIIPNRHPDRMVHCPLGNAGANVRTMDGPGMTSTGTNFEPTYFARQATKSDAKLRWQYERMLSFAGTRLYSSSRVLDIGCGA